MVHDPPSVIDPLRSSLFPRSDELDPHFVETLDAAREAMKEKPYDAVLLRKGLKRLGLESFRKLAVGRTALMVIDDDVPGYHRIEGENGERIVDQVFSHLGIARSQIFDRKVINQLGGAGSFTIDQVEFEGITDPVICARLDSDFDQTELPKLQRIAQVQGPGLAPTLEVFWDDPRPHVLHVVPPGLTLRRLMRARSEPGRTRPTAGGPGAQEAIALAVLRGVLLAAETLHRAGASIGKLGAPSIWLTTKGEVLLLGRALAQLAGRMEFATAVPPIEARPGQRQKPPVPEGDAFRLGSLLLEICVGENPFWPIGQESYAGLQWDPRNLPAFNALGGSRALGLALCAPRYEGPTGAALRELIEKHARLDATPEVLAEAVTAALAQPERWW